MIADFATPEIYAWLLIFCRLSGFFQSIPILGESLLPNRVKLTLAMLFAVILSPIVADQLPTIPQSPVHFVLIIIAEITVGFFLGALVRILYTALASSGTFIGLITGFASAELLNPQLNINGPLQAALLGMIGLLLMVIGDYHHEFLRVIIQSYWYFVPGEALMFGDMLKLMARTVGDMFALAMRIAMPYVIIMIVINGVMGIIARMMPTLPVFFAALPIQIGLGFLILFSVLPATMMWFFIEFQDLLIDLGANGK